MATLHTSPTSSSPRGPRVDAWIGKLTSLNQLSAALSTSDKTLDKAYELTKETPFVAKWVGLRTALRERINNISIYARKVKAGLPKYDPVSYVDRQKVALIIVQSSDTLNAVDNAISDPDLQLFGHFFSDLQKLFKGIGDIAADTFKATLPVLIPTALGLGFLALASSHFTTRTQKAT